VTESAISREFGHTNRLGPNPADVVTPLRQDGAMTNIDRRLTAIATGQLGIIGRAEAHAAGVTDSQLRSRIQSGTLVQIGPHTFRPYGARPSPVDDLRAVLHDLGPDAYASGPTAAALHGFDGFRVGKPFDIMLTHGHNMRRIGHRIHTTTELPLIDRARQQDCPTLSGARTVIDLARHLDDVQLGIAFDCGLRDGRFSEDLLHRRIVALRRSGRYGIPKLLRVIEGREIVSGAHSWLEREFLRVAHRAGLPRPLTQQVLSRAGDRMVGVDFRFPGTPIVVEVLGYRFHRSAAELTRDVQRQNALLSDGYLPYQYSYEQVVSRSDTVVTELRHALGISAA
jgi:hypothetical protein